VAGQRFDEEVSVRVRLDARDLDTFDPDSLLLAIDNELRLLRCAVDSRNVFCDATRQDCSPDDLAFRRQCRLDQHIGKLCIVGFAKRK
jgi:hypothetical protein